jgi:hypothetical protein
MATGGGADGNEYDDFGIIHGITNHDTGNPVWRRKAWMSGPVISMEASSLVSANNAFVFCSAAKTGRGVKSFAR